MLVISPQQPCGIGRYSLVSGNSPMRASDPTNHLQCLPQSIKVSPRRDEGIPPYRLLALPAAYYKKLCRERLIPVQEPNQRSGWPLKFDCGRSDLPYIFRITLPAKNLSPFYPIRPEKYVDKPPRFKIKCPQEKKRLRRFYRPGGRFYKPGKEFC